MKPIQLFIEVSALKVQKMVSQAPFPAKKTRAEWEGINQYYLCKIVRKWKPICIHFHDEVSVYITEQGRILRFLMKRTRKLLSNECWLNFACFAPLCSKLCKWALKFSAANPCSAALTNVENYYRCLLSQLHWEEDDESIAKTEWTQTTLGISRLILILQMSSDDNPI